MPKRLINQIGNRFGRWLVLEHAGRIGKENYWLCLCDCGTIKNVANVSLVKTRSESCGCLNKELTAQRSKTHGHTSNKNGKRVNSKEYSTWRNMLTRCYNVNNHAYDYYGGRGINVCQRWLDSFENFLNDVGYAPTPEHSLDRLLNDGNYEPGNVAWRTDKEQANNTRKNHVLEFQGQKKTISEWSDHLGIKQQTINNRLFRGWTIENALSVPTKATSRLSKRIPVHVIEFNGQQKRLSEWARDLGLTVRALAHRLSRGWTIERALTTPLNRQ